MKPKVEKIRNEDLSNIFNNTSGIFGYTEYNILEKMVNKIKEINPKNTHDNNIENVYNKILFQHNIFRDNEQVYYFDVEAIYDIYKSISSTPQKIIEHRMSELMCIYNKDNDILSDSEVIYLNTLSIYDFNTETNCSYDSIIDNDKMCKLSEIRMNLLINKNNTFSDTVYDGDIKNLEKEVIKLRKQEYKNKTILYKYMDESKIQPLMSKYELDDIVSKAEIKIMEENYKLNRLGIFIALFGMLLTLYMYYN